jgi:2-oxoisovalerate dehydrogenase E1 component alpha subunit
VRPGDAPDFSGLELAKAGECRRPEVTVAAGDIHDMAFSLIRVLDDDGVAQGPWDPKLDTDTLLRGLRAMLTARAFEGRMYRAQRQGKTTFFMKSTGEEAIGAAHALALNADDMCFATYRLASFLIARGYPVVDMMNQVFSNKNDPLKGLQLPVLYSSKAHSYFASSANVGTQFPQAVGWAMASALKNDTRIASAYIGDGSTAEGDFHNALTFAGVYRAPVVLNIVNNQWAISSFQGFSGGLQTTFASKAIGYGLPGLRVDGNDFLAVYAVMQWAAARARANLGATVIELYTYRVAAHSTADDPARYRPATEAEHWPLGDPILRLKQHLIARGAWSDDDQKALEAEIATTVDAAQKEAEAVGTFGVNTPDPNAMFDYVYKTPDWRLQRQRQELGD